jgi:hypothetical protein
MTWPAYNFRDDKRLVEDVGRVVENVWERLAPDGNRARS